MILKDKYRFVLQKLEYDCGVAATTTLLLNAGVRPPSYKKLGKALKLSKRGVMSQDIEKYILKYKKLDPLVFINAKLKNLRGELGRGRIAMVMYQSWGKKEEIENLDCGHYSIAVAIEKDKLYLLDPGAHKDWGDGVGFRGMSARSFARHWVDREGGYVIRGWMLSVKPLKV